MVALASGRSALGQAPAPLIANDRDANEQLMRILDTTRAHGLPVDPILSKVNYAVLIAHSPPQKIVAAARAIAARLPVAREALSPRDTPGDIAAAEIALSYAVPKEIVTQIRNASPDASVAVPLGALTQLVASRVSVKRASEIVLSLIKRGISGQQLASFSNDVNSDVLQGGHPDDALAVRMRLLSAALAPAGVVNATSGPTTAGTAPKPRP